MLTYTLYYDLSSVLTHSTAVFPFLLDPIQKTSTERQQQGIFAFFCVEETKDILSIAICNKMLLGNTRGEEKEGEKVHQTR